MGGDRIRHRVLSQCVDLLSKVLLQSYQFLQQLSYCDRGVRTVPIMTAQFLTIFFKIILLGTDDQMVLRIKDVAPIMRVRRAVTLTHSAAAARMAKRRSRTEAR